MADDRAGIDDSILRQHPELRKLSNLSIEWGEKKDDASGTPKKKLAKELNTIKLILTIYRIALINTYNSLELRQDAARADEKWDRLEIDLDTGGITKELKAELDPAYTMIKEALQFGDQNIPHLDRTSTGFQPL